MGHVAHDQRQDLVEHEVFNRRLRWERVPISVKAMRRYPCNCIAVRRISESNPGGSSPTLIYLSETPLTKSRADIHLSFHSCLWSINSQKMRSISCGNWLAPNAVGCHS